MNPRRESTIEAQIVAYAKTLGYDVMKFTSPGRSGVPDRLLINKEGVVSFIEVKRKGGKPEPLQQREIDKMNARRPFSARCVDNLDDAKIFLHFNQ